MYRFLPLLLLLSLCTRVRAQGDTGNPGSFAITVSIDGYEEDYLTLANNLLNNQYVVDTAYRSEDGSYTFRSDTSALPAGIYLVVTAPDNNYFQTIVTDAEQEFALRTSLEDLGKVTAESSPENTLFYDYLNFLGEQQLRAKELAATANDSLATPAEQAAANQRLAELDGRVKDYQARLAADHPESFTAAIIRTNEAVTPPEFAEISDADARRTAQWRWMQTHYFDNIDLTDARLLRTPFLVERVRYYLDNLTVQHPDTIAAATDFVLDKMDPRSELYKYYVVYFTNEAASSNIVGMDALYVHMIDEYYAKGKAYWTDEEQLKKMLDQAEKTRPLLIGKTAPNITVQRRDGSSVELYDVDTEYTVLYFWRYDCGACKKSTPDMKAFQEAWKDKGVTVFAVCVKGQKDLDKCWEYIDEKEIGDWLHVVDPYQRYYRKYDIVSTPSLFVLDQDKTIISKRLAAKQLPDLFQQIEERAAREAAANEASGK